MIRDRNRLPPVSVHSAVRPPVEVANHRASVRGYSAGTPGRGHSGETRTIGRGHELC